MRTYGLHVRVPGRTVRGKDLAVVYTKLRTAVIHGVSSPKAFPPSNKDWVGSEWRLLPVTQIASMQLLIRVRQVASSFRTTPANRGNGLPATEEFGHVVATLQKSTSILLIKRSSTAQPLRSINPLMVQRLLLDSKEHPAAMITILCGSTQTIQRSCCSLWIRAR